MAWRVLQSRARRSRRAEPRPLGRRHGGGALAIRGLREATPKNRKLSTRPRTSDKEYYTYALRFALARRRPGSSSEQIAGLSVSPHAVQLATRAPRGGFYRRWGGFHAHTALLRWSTL